MKKFSDLICKHKLFVVIFSLILLLASFVGSSLTKINYDILVYLPEDIETVEGQNILAEDFQMGAFSVAIIEDLTPKEILQLEEKIKEVDYVNQVVSLYDVVGTTIPIEFLPSEIVDKLHQGDSDLLLITFTESTSSEETLNAVEEIRDITKETCQLSGMSSMVLDTMDLAEREIAIYVVIAVILCLIVLEISLDSYLVPILLLMNIGFAIVFNLGSNILFGQISYITKALVAVLQLGVTTDFSIFLYHAYEKEKKVCKTKEEAMGNAIKFTFTSVTGSSLTTIAGFLVLCTMNLTLGRDLGLVMAKGVLLGVLCVLTLFPSLLLLFDNWIEKTRHRSIIPSFHKWNTWIVRHHIAIFVCFLVMLVPAYLAYSKVDVYYKLDDSLPKTLESVTSNETLKEQFNIVSPEIILIDKEMKTDTVNEMIDKIENIDGIEFVLSFSKLKKYGITENLLPEDIVSIFENDKYQMILINSSYDIATDELNHQVEEVNTILKEYDEDAILAGEGPLMKDLVTISDEDFNNVNGSSIICVLMIMFIILQSFSLPLLLILTIEFAIFLNMSISYFGGITLPFVAPIVLGTIQLGATIDYAILMTTTYLSNRKNTKDKKEAMIQTLDYCGVSIVVSGMCFFAATFGVGVYSELEMVGSLCTLISRGAIISMLVVLMVLPSILLMFDSIIQKTTRKGKEEKKMKIKKGFKKASVLLLVACMSLTALPVSALTKEEVIYSKLNSDGSTKTTFVQTHLINNEKLSKIEDVSDLTNIWNVNSDATFQQEGTKFIWNASGSDIFYQGTTNKDMPVSEIVEYYLNDQKMNVEDMIGKSGKVTIKITYENHDSHQMTVQGKTETLYTPFVVTTGTILSTKENSQVEVTNGKVINNGSSYMVVALSAPGLYESLDIESLKDLDTVTLSYETEKFELSSIYSLITPKLLEDADLEIFDELDKLYDSSKVLKSSIDEIETGSLSLLEGSKTLQDGSSQIYENLTIVVDKLEEIKTGTVSIDEGLQQVLTTLQGVENKLVSSTDSESITELQTLIATNTSTITTLKETNEQILKAYEDNQIDQMTSTEIEQNLQLYTIKYNYDTIYIQNQSIIALLEKNNEALTSTLSKLQSMQQEVQTMITTLETYLTQIEEGAKALSDGTVALKEGVSTLTSKMKELESGIGTLQTGIATLQQGIHQFNQEGITPITTYLNQDVRNVTSKMEALIQLSSSYENFGGTLDSVTGTTQFVYVIDSIRVPKETKKVETKEEKTTLWDRIKKLFQ